MNKGEDLRFELLRLPRREEPLHGLLNAASESRATVIHIHGTWGNFYGNRFVSSLAEVYATRGISFASLNFPGHDETSMTERIQEFADALEAWISFLAPTGPIILQGHSLGASKIALTQLTDRAPRGFAGAVLLAPFDVVAFYAKALDPIVSPTTQPSRALESVANLDDADLLPRERFDHWLLSAGTLRAALTDDAWDQFPVRYGDPGRFLESISVPKLVLLGSEDSLSLPNPMEFLSVLSRGRETRAALIEGAPHNFAGFEDVVGGHVAAWLDEHVLGDARG